MAFAEETKEPNYSFCKNSCGELSRYGATVPESLPLVIQFGHFQHCQRLAQIVQMVQQAQSSKPPIGRLVDVISSYFVLSVMIIAVITFLVWFHTRMGVTWAHENIRLGAHVASTRAWA